MMTQIQDDQDLQDLEQMVSDLENDSEEETSWNHKGHKEKKSDSHHEKNKKQWWNDQISDLLLKIQKLESELKEKEEITQKAQIAYLHLKNDFDLLSRQTQAKEKTMQQDTLIKVIKNILPFIDNLRKSLETLTEEQKQEWLGRGVEMIYENCLKSLTELNVFPIESIWLEVDSQMHEPVSMIPTDDQKMKGKIISVFEQGFYYEKEDVKIVIIPSKVVIGQ